MCTLAVTPNQVRFKVMGNGKIEREINKQIGVASTVMQALYQIVVIKSELSRKAYGHELWVVI